jgi:alpha-D-xyloside xylohydrolase
MKMLTRWMCVLVLAGCAADAPEGSFVQNESGIVVTPADGASRRVRLEVRTDRIVRVTSVTDGNLDLPKSLMVLDTAPKPVAF